MNILYCLKVCISSTLTQLFYIPGKREDCFEKDHTKAVERTFQSEEIKAIGPRIKNEEYEEVEGK